MYKLLIADDEQLEREAVKFIVNQKFPGIFEIFEAANGREALEKSRLFMPDLIFLDIKMPGINGLQAATQINAFLPDCRIIIVTAYHYFNYAKEALSLGVADYITKPVPEETVVATVQRVMADIELKITKKRQDKEREERLKQITQYFEDDLLVPIVYGEIEEKVIEEYFEVLNFQPQAFLAAVASDFYQNVPSETTTELEKRLLKKNIVEWLKNYFQKNGVHAFIRSIGREIYILLLLDESLDEYQSRLRGIQIFNEIKELLQTEKQISLSIGMGRICNSVHEIYQAFLQAKNALRYETLPGSIMSFSDIQKDSHHTIYPVNKEKKLLQSILLGNLPLSLQLLDELIGWFSENTVNIETFQQKIYELLLVLIRETVTNINLSEFEIDTEELRRNIKLLRQIEDISSFAKDYLLKRITEINTIKTSRAIGLLSLAIEYMEHNYQSDLSLEDVAKFIQISPFYLSKIFKKEFGGNFIDYLTELRIQKAKEFLTNPLMTVKDVCYQVGYKDPNYFARVFKKICGITPTEYQAKKMC